MPKTAVVAAGRAPCGPMNYNRRVRRALPHALGFGLPVAMVAGVRPGGAWILLPVVLLLGVLPFLDWLGGLNLENPGGDESLSGNPWFRAITWLWTAVQPAMIWWALTTWRFLNAEC